MIATNKSINRAIPVLINGAITLLVAWPVAHWLGIARPIDVIAYQLGDAGLAIICLWYAVVFVGLAAMLRGSAMLCGLQLLGGNASIDLIGWWISSAIRAGLTNVRSFLTFVIATPLLIARDALWKPVEDKIFEWINAWDIDQQLRAEYRKSFRNQYRSFAEFKRAYYGEEPEQEQAKPEPQAKTSIDDALALLGLAKDCTREALIAKHRDLMKRNHPDVGGTDGLAAKINEAKAIVMKERNWA